MTMYGVAWEPFPVRDCILSILAVSKGRRIRETVKGYIRDSAQKEKRYLERGGGWKYRSSAAPRERLKVKLRSAIAREFGFSLVTE